MLWFIGPMYLFLLCSGFLTYGFFNSGREYLGSGFNRNYSVSGPFYDSSFAFHFIGSREQSLNVSSFTICSFTSTPDKVSNKYYLGPAPLEDMAR